MDLFLLKAVVAETAVRLVEQEVLRVSHLGRHRYLIRFATAAHDALLVSVRPDLPRLHLARGRRLDEEPPDPFAARLDQEIGGAILSGMTMRPWDRVVSLEFRRPDGGGRTLLVELLGRSANLLVLDSGGTILASCRDLASAYRAPRPGGAYVPPPGRTGCEALPEGPEAVGRIRERFGDPVAFLDRISPMMARDLRAGAPQAAGPVRAGEQEQALVALLDRAARGDWEPVIHSTRPLEEWREGDLPGRDDVEVSALPLAHPVPSPAGRTAVTVRFESASQAAGTGFGLVERLRDFRALSDHHAAIARREVSRLETLMTKLRDEMQRAAASDRERRLGEALLASLGTARVEGRTARVADPYHPDGPDLVVPIDPALSLQDNAQVLFARYKKGKRGVAAIGARTEAAGRALASWRELARAAGEIRCADDLERLRSAMGALGLVHAARARRAPPPRPERDAPVRVRRHTGPDGLEILVGRSGDENDTLTFKIASPWDFWLHAADRPGAHVVVRNPRRLREIPEPTLRLAAGIAAFYSGARKESKAEVHYTQRKHVHKRRGMPAGQVTLRRFRTIQVTPRLPVSTVEDV